jgi:hypothetical protein
VGKGLQTIYAPDRQSRHISKIDTYIAQGSNIHHADIFTLISLPKALDLVTKVYIINEGSSKLSRGIA